MPRSNWPASWGRDFEILAASLAVTAEADGDEVVLYGTDLRDFARVPADIEPAQLARIVPLLKASYATGVAAGRAQLASELRELLGVSLR